MQVEIISGSTRKDSQTHRIALHLYKKLQKGREVGVGLISLNELNIAPVEKVINTSSDAPDGIKPVVQRILDADAFILVSPEYNGSYSPGMKTFFDHFPKQTQKTFGLVTASPGVFGGMRAAMQLQSLTYGLMGIGSPQMLIVPELQTKFDENGQLTDLAFGESINTFVDDFLWLAHAVACARTAMAEKK